MIIEIAKRDVPSGTIQMARGEVSVPCRPERLVIPRSIGERFWVHSFVVRRCEWIDGRTGVPAEVFSGHPCRECGAQDSMGGADLDFGELELMAGDSIFVQVENRDGQVRDFGAVLEARHVRAGDEERAYMSHGRLIELVRTSVATLRSPDARWPDSAHKVAGALERAIGDKRRT